MTSEELKRFKKTTADPAMERLLAHTQLREGTCYIDELELAYLDGRNFGVDTFFKASGLILKNGAVRKFEHMDNNCLFRDFLCNIMDCNLVLDGKLLITDELKELEITTTICSAHHCAPLFKDLAFLESLPHCCQTEEYIKMCHIYQSDQKSMTQHSQSLDSMIQATLQRRNTNPHSRQQREDRGR